MEALLLFHEDAHCIKDNDKVVSFLCFLCTCLRFFVRELWRSDDIDALVALIVLLNERSRAL